MRNEWSTYLSELEEASEFDTVVNPSAHQEEAEAEDLSGTAVPERPGIISSSDDAGIWKTSQRLPGAC